MFSAIRLPTQLLVPNPKGSDVKGLNSLTSLRSHRSGINSSGFVKYFGSLHIV